MTIVVDFGDLNIVCVGDSDCCFGKTVVVDWSSKVNVPTVGVADIESAIVDGATS